MKQFIIILVSLLTLLMPLSSIAQTDYQIPQSIPANNGELDWLVFKDRGGEIKIDKKNVIIKSKTKSVFLSTISSVFPTLSYAKVPVNFNGDFYISATMKPDKVDEKHLFGLAFNVANENDYNAVMFDHQFCYYVRVMNGVLAGLRDRVIYKYHKAPKGVWKIAIERKNGGDYVVTLNGLEVRTFPASTQFMFPAIGGCVINKGELKILEVSFGQWAAPADEE